MEIFLLKSECMKLYIQRSLKLSNYNLATQSAAFKDFVLQEEALSLKKIFCKK